MKLVGIGLNANPNTLWEVIKGYIRNTTIRYTSFKQKETHNLETENIKIIETLGKQLHQTNTNDTTDIENEITLKKTKIRWNLSYTSQWNNTKSACTAC